MSKSLPSLEAVFHHFYVLVSLLVITLSTFVDVANSQQTRDVLVDDNDSRISYSDGWSLAQPTELNIGGNHMLAESPDAFATFEFVGIALYFYSPLWPYHVTTGLQLDNEPSEVIELIDQSRTDAGNGSETVQSAIVWGRTGLANATHTLRIFVGAGEPYAIVDAIGYTELLPSDSNSNSQSTPPSATSSGNPTNPTTGQSNNDSRDSSDSGPPLIPIIVGAVAGVVALLVLLGIFLYCRRRNKRESRIESDFWKAQTATTANFTGGPSGPGAPGSSTRTESNQGFRPHASSLPASSPATSTLPLRQNALAGSDQMRSDTSGMNHYGTYSPNIASPSTVASGAASRNSYSIYSQQSQNSLRTQGSNPGMTGIGTMLDFSQNRTSTATSGYASSPLLFSQRPLVPPAGSGPRGSLGPGAPYDAGRLGGDNSGNGGIGPLPNPHASSGPTDHSQSQSQSQYLNSQFSNPPNRLTPLRPPSAAPPAYTEGEQGPSVRPLGDVKFRVMNPPPQENQSGGSFFTS
ncbi:hypothetical protein AX16_001639 [Volvariella volvacea WC 439]|nr:hypothetical protein AX16_001639 [Volvariella volvacea WC 439]